MREPAILRSMDVGSLMLLTGKLRQISLSEAKFACNQIVSS